MLRSGKDLGFPSYHRSEAKSKLGVNATTAGGIGLQKGGFWDLFHLRVTNQDKLQLNNQLDRWD